MTNEPFRLTWFVDGPREERIVRSPAGLRFEIGTHAYMETTYPADPRLPWRHQWWLEHADGRREMVSEQVLAQRMLDCAKERPAPKPSLLRRFLNRLIG